MPANTTNLSFQLPIVGSDTNSWGGYLNANWTALDALLWGSATIRPDLAEGLWEIGGVPVTATAAELNALDGITATVAELNKLSGATPSTAEINYLTGVTSAIQAQLDARQPLDAELTAIAGLTSAANKIPMFSGPAAAVLIDRLDEDDFASNSATGVPTQQSVKAYIAATSNQYMQVEQQETSGTAGGGTTATTWVERTLDTAVTNNISGASVGSNRITLPAGTYWIEADAPAYRINAHRVRLYNVTDAAVIAYGSSAVSIASADTSPTVSAVSALVSIAGTKAISLEHYTAGTRPTDGFGLAVGDGSAEIYARVRIWRIPT